MRPTRKWALIATMVWAALLLTIYGQVFINGFLKGYSEATGEKEGDEEKVDDISKCRTHLLEIEGCKKAWLLDHPTPTPVATTRERRSQRQRPAATPPVVERKENPSESDLFGPQGYMLEKPRCPKGGSYILGTVDEPPRCTYPNHSLDFGLVLVVNESGGGVEGAKVWCQNAERDDHTLTTGTNGLSTDTIPLGFYRKGIREMSASCRGYKSAAIAFPTNWPAKITLQKEEN